MKKILFTFFILVEFVNVYAIEDIKINGKSLIPYFDNNTKKYNYYTDDDNVIINVKHNKEEKILGDGSFKLHDGLNELIINSDTNGEFIINIYKNYVKSKGEKGLLKNLNILGYNINFDKNKYEYDIDITKDEPLTINYELSDLSSYVEIIGNGNFNKTKNTITINVDNINKYTINVYKTSLVSNEIDNNNISEKEMSYTQKEIVKIIIITISCILVFLLYYMLFIKKLF